MLANYTPKIKHISKKKKKNRTNYLHFALFNVTISKLTSNCANQRKKKEINHHFITPCVHNPDQAINNCNLLI